MGNPLNGSSKCSLGKNSKLFQLKLRYCKRLCYSSANATPAFEGRGGEDLATEISTGLARAYVTFPLERLCILPGLQCWRLYADILVLECGGNLFDAVSLAVKVCLLILRLSLILSLYSQVLVVVYQNNKAIFVQQEYLVEFPT